MKPELQDAVPDNNFITFVLTETTKELALEPVMCSQGRQCLNPKPVDHFFMAIINNSMHFI